MATRTSGSIAAPRRVAPAPAAARSTRFGLWPRLLLVLGGLLLPLLCFELTLRLFGAVLPGNYRIGSFLTHHPVFGTFHPLGTSGWYRTSEFVTHFQFSDKGLRGREVEYAKPPGTYRVLMLGDSFVDSLEVPLEARFSELIQARLDRELGPGRVELINAGVVGWSNAQEVVYFEQEGYRFEPDLVLLLVYPHNDINHNVTDREESAGPRDRPYFALRGPNQLELLPVTPHVPSPAESLDRATRRALLLYDWFQTGLIEKQEDDELPKGNELSRVYQENYDPKVEYAWDGTTALLGRLRDAVAARGGRLAIVGVPSKFQVYQEDWRDLLTRYKANPRSWDAARPNQKLANIARRAGIPAVNLLPIFQREAELAAERLYYRYDVHWTAPGHRVAADALYDFLLSTAQPG